MDKVYEAGVFFVTRGKSNLNSHLLILREVEKRTGKPAAFIETDLVDPRYFSAANVKNRLESYFQMVKQKRTYGHPDPGHLARAIPIQQAH